MERITPFSLPDELLLGCATAATQIEGGDTNNSWYEWAQKPGVIRDGSSPFRANDHWRRLEADTALMAEIGLQCYRLGVEWSRIEPEEGRFDPAAIEHYRQELQLLREKGIRPLVTLHHFSNPLWFERKGAFENESSIPVFRRFVDHVVTALQDLCDEYVTINEPNVYATMGYVFGTWPPGRKNSLKAFRIMKHLAMCHIHAYRDIHRIFGNRPVQVGFANHLRVFDPLSASPLDRMGARLLDHLFQGAVTEAFMTGRFKWPVGSGAPLGEGRYYDFIGINNYTRNTVSGLSYSTKQDTDLTDLGWEIYPKGLADLCKAQYQRYQAPIWITENGICAADDRKRVAYISDHLRQALASGTPVERYYYWTFMDNFEWAEGESAPFGLVACDFTTQERSVRPSGRFYQELIQNRQLSQDMIDRYLN